MNNSCSCPQCGSKAFKKNGYTRHNKQNHRCLDCGRQFSLFPTDIAIIPQPMEAEGAEDEFLVHAAVNKAS